MTYRIMGKYNGSCAEEIDSAETEDEANYLLNEYRLAFGKDWMVWIKKV